MPGALYEVFEDGEYRGVATAGVEEFGMGGVPAVGQTGAGQTARTDGQTGAGQLARTDGQPKTGKPALTSGELALIDSFGKALPLSIYVRLER